MTHILWTLTDSPEIDDVIYNCSKDNATDSYNKYIGADVVLSDWKGDKPMGKVKKNINYDDISIGEG